MAPWIAWLLGLLAVFYPTFTSTFRRMQGGAGDSRLVNFVLEHGYRWISGAVGHGSLWDPPIYFPQANVSAYTDLLLGAAPPYWLLRMAGLPPDTAFQGWMIVIWSLNFLAMHIFLRRAVRLGPLAASVGSYLFAFGSPRVANMIHQQLVPHFFVVAAVGAGTALLRPSCDRSRAGERGWILLFVAALVAQAYTAFYTFFFSGLILAFATLVALAMQAFRTRITGLLRERWPSLVIATLLGLLVLLPIAHHYLEAKSQLPGYAWERNVEKFVPRPPSWMYLGRTSWLYGWLADCPLYEGHQGRTPHANGWGLLTTLLVLAGFVGRRSWPGVRLLGIVSLGVVVVSSSWWGGWSLWRVVYELVPGGDAIRAVGRVGILLLFPAAVLLALTFERLSRSSPLVIGLLLFTLCAVEQIHRPMTYDKGEVRQRISRLAAAVPAHCTSFYLAFEEARCPQWRQDDAMWTALEVGIPTINGRFGHWPPSYQLKRNCFAAPRARAKLRGELDRWIAIHSLESATTCWVEHDPGGTPDMSGR